MNPDYSQWAKKTLWRVYEAISLVLGVEPPVDAPQAVHIGPEGVVALIHEDVRQRWGELYGQTKDAIDLKELKATPGRIADAWLEKAVKPMPFCEWAAKMGYDTPPPLAEALGIQAASPASEKRGKPVPSAEIIHCFRVKPDDRKNGTWWNDRMRAAKKYGLVTARAAPGRSRTPSHWYPAEVATWLADKKHFPVKKAADILRKHFPECGDTADLLDDSQ